MNFPSELTKADLPARELDPVDDVLDYDYLDDYVDELLPVDEAAPSFVPRPWKAENELYYYYPVEGGVDL